MPKLTNLRRERELRLLSQRDLAARAGVSAPTIVSAEAGRGVTPRVAQAITAALELVEVRAVSRELQEVRASARADAPGG